MIYRLGIFLGLFVSLSAQASRSHYSYKEGKENFVKQIYQKAGQPNLAVLDIKNKNYIKKGTLLNVYRWARPNDAVSAVKIKTGEIKVTSASRDAVLGYVIQDGDTASSAIFSNHPGVMAGDEIETKNIQIVAKTIVAPEMTIEYRDLFNNPTRFNQSFDLSETGREKLQRVVSEFGHLRTSKLIIEGHTDSQGAAKDNQVESLQRAQAIKHQLVENYGFDENRLVALGFGETEPVKEVYYPGIENVNRRIVIRVSIE